MKLSSTAVRLSGRTAVFFFGVALAAIEAHGQGLQISGNPAAMIITTAVAGSPPTPKTNASTTLRISGSSGSWHVVARLNSNTPAGVTLQVNLAAPAGGSTSVGNVTLDTTNRTLVNNIGNIGNTFCTLTYTLSATVLAGVVASQNRTVTFSILAGA
jgi:hypothetical protein